MFQCQIVKLVSLPCPQILNQMKTITCLYCWRTSLLRNSSLVWILCRNANNSGSSRNSAAWRISWKDNQIREERDLVDRHTRRRRLKMKLWIHNGASEWQHILTRSIPRGSDLTEREKSFEKDQLDFGTSVIHLDGPSPSGVPIWRRYLQTQSESKRDLLAAKNNNACQFDQCRGNVSIGALR